MEHGTSNRAMPRCIYDSFPSAGCHSATNEPSADVM